MSEQGERRVDACLASDKGRAFLKQKTMQAAGGTPADLKAFIASELAKWGSVVRAAKIEM